MNPQEQHLLAKHLIDALNNANKRIIELEEKIKKLEKQKNKSNVKLKDPLIFKD
jgi:hypothetical protein